MGRKYKMGRTFKFPHNCVETSKSKWALPIVKVIVPVVGYSVVLLTCVAMTAIGLPRAVLQICG
jgi:hypothetical protein